MKYILIISSILLVQCCTGNKTRQTSAITTDTSSGIIEKDTQHEAGTKVEPTWSSDTIPVKPKPSSERQRTIDLEYGTFHTTSVPACLRSYVKRIMDDEVKNPPQKIFSYKYKGSTVYYVTAPCCDFFSDLLSADCELIAHPDGGITGKGDGRAADFHKLRSGEKLVWEDPRLPR